MEQLPDESYQMQAPSERWDEQFAGEMSKSIKELVTDQIAETNLANFPVWAITTKTSKLTFLDKWDVSRFESLFEADLCKYYRSVPPCMHNDEMYQVSDQARMISFFNLRRSQGSENTNKLNERTAIVTQIKQSVSSGGFGGGSGQGKPSLLKRMFGGR